MLNYIDKRDLTCNRCKTGNFNIISPISSLVSLVNVTPEYSLIVLGIHLLHLELQLCLLSDLSLLNSRLLNSLKSSINTNSLIAKQKIRHLHRF